MAQQVSREVGPLPYTDSLFSRAAAFYHQYYAEESLGSPSLRLAAIQREIDHTGTYTHTYEELEYGAKVAWRNSNRCIGRLYWKTLKVRDQRHLKTEDEIFDALVDHLRLATNGGKIRSTITVFRAEDPYHRSALRIKNTQLIRYAGYAMGDTIVGDPAQVAFTRQCQQLGWQGAGTPFDVLPLLLQVGDRPPRLYELPPSAVMEVPLRHPTLPWFESMGLKWPALPVIADMTLEIGGIHYTAAPFNGWYMVTEIASRNLGDIQRYNLLPQVAEKLGMDTSTHSSLWKDRALLELNTAVLDSYQRHGVSMVDHHTASEQFMHFVGAEERQGRSVTGDWAWLVPPMSGSATGVFHHPWNNEIRYPNYVHPIPDHYRENGPQTTCPFLHTQ